MWSTLPLGRIASIRSGGTPDRKNPKYWEDGGILWVTTSEVDYSIITTSKEQISEEGLQNSSAKVFPEGTLLIALYGQGKTRGQVGILGVSAATNQACAAVLPSADFDTKFLFYVLQNDYRRIRAMSNSGGQDNLSAEIVREIRIPGAPLPEQRKIAEILRTWDEALEKLTALRAAHEDRLYGLRDSLMARASHRGQPLCFGDFLTESRIPGTDGATARKISVRLYGKGATEKTVSRRGSANTRYYRRAAGQIIWSKLDFLNGAFALVGPELDGCESTLDLPAFDCDPSVNPVWLIEYLTRPAYYTRQLHLARGQRKARRIAPDDWLASPLRLPDRATQDHIAEALTCART